MAPSRPLLGAKQDNGHGSTRKGPALSERSLGVEQVLHVTAALACWVFCSDRLENGAPDAAC